MSRWSTAFRTGPTFVDMDMRKLDMRLDDYVALSALLAEVIADKAGDPSVRPYAARPAPSRLPAPDCAIHPSGQVTRRLSQRLYAGV
jgi:hypothetical protein